MAITRHTVQSLFLRPRFPAPKVKLDINNNGTRSILSPCGEKRKRLDQVVIFTSNGNTVVYRKSQVCQEMSQYISYVARRAPESAKSNPGERNGGWAFLRIAAHLDGMSSAA